MEKKHTAQFKRSEICAVKRYHHTPVELCKNMLYVDIGAREIT